MLKKKKALAMSVLCAVASVGFVVSASAETMHGNLAEVVVEGSKDELPGGLAKEAVTIGMVGKQDIMSAPMTVSEISKKLLKNLRLLMVALVMHCLLIRP